MIKRFFSSEGGVIDWSIIFVVMMLALIGLASLYVAGVHDTVGVNVWRMVIMQGAYYIVGIIAVMVIMRFDSRTGTATCETLKPVPVIPPDPIAFIACHN